MPWSVFTLKRGRTIEASYSGTDFGRDFNPDNVVVDRNPVFTGYVKKYRHPTACEFILHMKSEVE